MNSEDALDHYLGHVVRTGPVRPRHIEAPVGPKPMAHNDIRDLLADPALLFGGANPATEPRERMALLIRFALWLDEADMPGELASRAARYRFLVWSLPARLPVDVAAELCPEAVLWPSRVDSYLTELSDGMIRNKARAAREDWLRQLAEAEDDPWLAALQTDGDRGLERDLRWLTRAWPQRGGVRGRLDLADPDSRSSTAEHRRVAAEVAETHWLPRAAIRQAVLGFGPRRPWLALVAVTAFPAASAALVVLLLADKAELARTLSVVVIGAGAFVVTFLVPVRVEVLALLRIPAAAAAGNALLLSLTPRWWLAGKGWTVGVAMILAVWCYVTVEARLHGAPRWLATGRAAIVSAVGALYAFVLAVAFLGFVVPTMGETGRCLDGWWRADPLAPLQLEAAYCRPELGQDTAAWPAGALLLMTGWSLAVGVAAQVLWDDRPLTAPLGRLRRVRGTRA